VLFRSVADLLYWMNTPIPVYVAIVELITKRIFILEARNVARELEAQIGNSWASCATRRFDVPVEALYTVARGQELARDVVEYWDGIRVLWQEAVYPPRRMIAADTPRREDFLDVAHRQAKKEALHFQSTLAEVLGGRAEMLRLLAQASLSEISPW